MTSRGAIHTSVVPMQCKSEALCRQVVNRTRLQQQTGVLIHRQQSKQVSWAGWLSLWILIAGISRKNPKPKEVSEEFIGLARLLTQLNT